MPGDGCWVDVMLPEWPDESLGEVGGWERGPSRPVSPSLTSCTHTPHGSTSLSLACRPSTALLGVPQPSGSRSSSFSRRWVEMTWWDLRLPAPLWASVSGPGLRRGGWRQPPPSSPTLRQLRRPPHTDRQDPFIFSNIQPLLLVRASASSLSTSCPNQTASSDPGPANQSIPFLWPQ